MAEAIILDFDGVIVDSEPMHLREFAVVVQEMGFDISHDPTLMSYIGSADVDLYRQLCELAGRTPDDAQFAEISRRKWDRASAAITRGDTPAYAGTIRLIHEARGRVPLAVCSGARRHEIELILRLLGLEMVFRVVVTADDVHTSKPDPLCYRITAERLGIPAAKCVAVEDTNRGIRAAKLAGMRVAAVGHTLPSSRLREADLVVSTSADLTVDRLLAL